MSTMRHSRGIASEQTWSINKVLQDLNNTIVHTSVQTGSTPQFNSMHRLDYYYISVTQKTNAVPAAFTIHIF